MDGPRGGPPPEQRDYTLRVRLASGISVSENYGSFHVFGARLARCSQETEGIMGCGGGGAGGGMGGGVRQRHTGSTWLSKVSPNQIIPLQGDVAGQRSVVEI